MCGSGPGCRRAAIRDFQKLGGADRRGSRCSSQRTPSAATWERSGRDCWRAKIALANLRLLVATNGSRGNRTRFLAGTHWRTGPPARSTCRFRPSRTCSSSGIVAVTSGRVPVRDGDRRKRRSVRPPTIQSSRSRTAISRMGLTSLLSAMLDVPGRDGSTGRCCASSRSSGENKTFFKKVRGVERDRQEYSGLGLNGLGDMLGELSGGVGAVKQRSPGIAVRPGPRLSSIGCLVMEACGSVLAEADHLACPATSETPVHGPGVRSGSDIPYQKILRQTAAGIRLDELLSSQLPAFFASRR